MEFSNKHTIHSQKQLLQITQRKQSDGKMGKGLEETIKTKAMVLDAPVGSFILGLRSLQRSSTAPRMPTTPQGPKAGFRACQKYFLITHFPPTCEAEGQGIGPGLVGAGQGGMGGVSRRE